MKVKEIRELTDSAIEEQIQLKKKELFNLRLKKAAYDLDNTSQLRVVRKNVATLNTILNERSNAKGAEGGE